MNKKLQQAETLLLEILNKNPKGLTMDQILEKLQKKVQEAEIRAAVWTLRAEGAADFDDGKLKAFQAA